MIYNTQKKLLKTIFYPKMPRKKKNLEKKIFLICPVRDIQDSEKKFLNDYVTHLEGLGYKVHWPYRDTVQKDPIGLFICLQNREAIKLADEIHIYWNPESMGSKFDLGMTFMIDKPVILVNKYMVKRTSHKSFENVLLELDSQYNKKAF